jgi:hypothetical protein
MSDLSDVLENALLNHVLRDTAYTPPGTNVFIALYTSATSDTGGGTEVSGGSYARVRVQGTGAWDAPSNGATANTAEIAFPQASASWGTITHVAIKDSSTSTGSNNHLWHGALTSPKAVGNGDTFKFSAGDLDVTLA